jgi:small subunit ribosomal protein S5
VAQEQGQGQGGRDQGGRGNRDNRGAGREGNRRDGGNENQRDDNLQDRVVNIARVAKVVKGGRRFSFSALVVVGDGKDMVGFGLGKANEVPDAIRKGGEQAKKDMIKVRKVGNTIPYEVVGRYGSAKVLMYPAKQGKGIIAGGAVRIIAELAGIHDIVCKVHGTRNHQNVVRAVIDGLKQLESIEDYSRNLGKEAHEILQSRH